MTRSSTVLFSQPVSIRRRALVAVACVCVMLVLAWSREARAQSLLELFRAADAVDPSAAGARAQQRVMQHRIEQARAA
jgi:hypothetical protein